jgi:hypothetical protein
MSIELDTLLYEPGRTQNNTLLEGFFTKLEVFYTKLGEIDKLKAISALNN